MASPEELWLLNGDPDCAYNVGGATLKFKTLSEEIAWTALRWAVHNHWDKVLTTLRMGSCSATVVVRGQCYDGSCSFVHFAARAGRTDVLQVLRTEFHIRMDTADGLLGWTPLAFAIRGNHLEAVRWLVSQPETLLTARTFFGLTVVDMARKWAGDEIRQCIADEARRRARWSPLRAGWFAAAAGARLANE